MNERHVILVIGSTGQLGQSIYSLSNDYSSFDFIFVSREQLDLSDEKSIAEFFMNNIFDIIINCAAYTNVTKAESEPELANQINNLAVQQLASLAKKYKVKLIHISTDYVFSGEFYRPYQEDDEAVPHCVYGRTKFQGEQAIKKILKSKAIIIRTSWMYSEYGENFIKTILKLGQERKSINVVCDQIGTPTYSKDLAKAIMTIIQSEEFNQEEFKTNVFHFSNEGICSWYDFAKVIFELTGIQCQVNPIETIDYPVPVKRPHYSVLSKAKIKKIFHLPIPYWKDSIKVCLTKLKVKEL